MQQTRGRTGALTLSAEFLLISAVLGLGLCTPHFDTNVVWSQTSSIVFRGSGIWILATASGRTGASWRWTASSAVLSLGGDDRRVRLRGWRRQPPSAIKAGVTRGMLSAAAFRPRAAQSNLPPSSIRSAGLRCGGRGALSLGGISLSRVAS